MSDDYEIQYDKAKEYARDKDWDDIREKELGYLFGELELTDSMIGELFGIDKRQVTYKRRKYNITQMSHCVLPHILADPRLKLLMAEHDERIIRAARNSDNEKLVTEKANKIKIGKNMLAKGFSLSDVLVISGLQEDDFIGPTKMDLF